MNRLLIAHHDSVFLRKLTAELSCRAWDKIVTTANDSAHLVCAQYLQPSHVILLDMSLPEIDRVMEFLRNDSSHPVILALLDSRHDILKALKMGASDCVVRPVMPDSLCDRLGELMISGKPAVNPLFRGNPQRIRRVMFDLGLSTRLKGSRYLEQALLLIADNPRLLDSLTARLYPALMKITNDTPANIDRCLRYIISSSWKRMTNEQKRLFSADPLRKPSVKAFLATLARLI